LGPFKRPRIDTCLCFDPLSGPRQRVPARQSGVGERIAVRAVGASSAPPVGLP